MSSDRPPTERGDGAKEEGGAAVPPVCFEDDAYVRDRMRWVVLLDDGRFVYEDDDRPGVDPPSAWVRLKAHLSAHHLSIHKMWLQFRGNVVQVPGEDAHGYYLVKCVYGVWGDAETYHAYVVGSIRDGKLRVTKYRTPELLVLEEEEERAIDPHSPSLILRFG